MEATAVLDLNPKTDADFEAAIDRCLVEMRRMVDDIAATRRQIETSRAETEATLLRLEALV